MNRWQMISDSLMFWLFAGLGAAVTVPCLLAPALEAYRTLRDAEQQQSVIVQELKEQLARQERFSEALRSDPQVNLRLAQRELNYRQPGAVRHVSAKPQAARNAERPSEPALPAWMTRWYRDAWLVPFRNDNIRLLLLGLSLSLVVYSLAVFGEPAGRAE